MLYKDPPEKKLKEARRKTFEKQIRSMLEEEFLQRRTFHDAYSPYMCEKILQVGEQGGGRSQMMKVINVRTVKTFNKWLEDNEEFKDAYELAQVYCQAYLEDLILKKSTGENTNIDPKAIQLLMGARFPEYKKEAGQKAELNININNSLEALDDHTLNERIKQQVKQLGYDRVEDIEDGVIIEH